MSNHREIQDSKLPSKKEGEKVDQGMNRGG